jgi:hypothetical protein
VTLLEAAKAELAGGEGGGAGGGRGGEGGGRVAHAGR